MENIEFRNTKNVWKQPIPTNLKEVFGGNYLAKHIYIELLLRARNSNERPEEEFAGRLHFLRRGQCVCGCKELASEFGVDHKTIRKVLRKLQNLYRRVELKNTNKGTVVTITNYDDVVKMERKTENNGNSKGTQRPPNKSDESVESDKDITPVPAKRVSRCPLEEPGKDAHLLSLASQNPNGHRECLEYINSVSEDKGHKFINYPKQIQFVHRILRAGFNFDQMDEGVSHLEKDRFYQEKGWDFANLAQYLERR